MSGCHSHIPSLKSIYFYPTGYCNLKCSHCWIAPPHASRSQPYDHELSLDEISAFYDQAKLLGLTHTKLTGGEPLLRYGIQDVLRLIHEKNITLQIETNATLIDTSMADLLGEIYRKDRDLFISVSIDGNEVAHDHQRRVPGSYLQAVEGIKNLLRVGIHVQVIFCANRKNRDTILEVAELCKGLEVNSLKINFINDIERANALNTQHELLSVEETIEFNRYLIEELEPQFPFRVITNLPPAFKPLKDFVRGGRCSIFGIMGVLSNGDISLCGIGTSVPELIEGNVKTASLKTVWEQGKLYTTLREDVPSKFEGVCGKCSLKSFCLGECRADAYYKKHSLSAPFGFCQRALEEGRFPKKWLLVERKPPIYGVSTKRP